MKVKDLFKFQFLNKGIAYVKSGWHLILMGTFTLLLFTTCERSDVSEKEPVIINSNSELKTSDDRSDEFYEDFEQNATILLEPEELLIENENYRLYNFQISSELIENFKEPFVLYLQNGTVDPATRLTGAKVTIDEEVIVSPRGFNQTTESLRKEIQINANSEIEILIEGGPGCFAELTIKGIPAPNTVTDIDGNTYKTVKIGNQVWMAENLKTTHFADGTVIPYVTDHSEWADLGDNNIDKAYCFYDNNLSNKDIYGALYTWAAAMNGENSSDTNPGYVQGVCPGGWHLPGDAEWKELEIYLGMTQTEANNIGCRGTNEGSKLAGNEDLWIGGALETDVEFNTSGFSALPSGIRYFGTNFNFDGANTSCFFWSSTEQSSTDTWSRYLSYYLTEICKLSRSKSYGFSVRCVKD